MKSTRFIISAILIFISYQAFAQSDPVNIHRMNGNIRFDGIPDDPAWKLLQDFHLTMWKPDFGSGPSEESDIRIGYDDQYLWISASLFMKDPSKLFIGTKKRDEMVWDFDAFGILLDTYNDNENGLAFFTNPEGLRTDFTISNDAAGGGGRFGFMNTSWDTFWDVKTSIDDKGWYLEMRIPFSSLKFRSENGSVTMGMILSRYVSANNELDMYPSIDPKFGVMANLKPSQAVKVVFEGPQPSKPVYIAPYVTAGYLRNNVMNETGTEYIRENKPSYNAGLDVKYNINSNLTLDLTANTDFAQVESDDQQVNLTRYSMFFPEKRKFFQERSGLFDFNLGGFDNLFYSRAIGMSRGMPVRIFGGARLTGRVGKWDLGMLDMQTEEEDATPGYNYGVIRMRRQVINENSYAGGIFTSRIGMNGEQNYAYGLDGNFRIVGQDYLSVKFAQTYDSRLDNKMTSLDPTFIMANWEKRSQEGFVYDLNYYYSGQEFNPGIGFIRRTGVQGGGGRLMYGWLPGQESKFFRTSMNVRGNFFTRLSDGKFESASISPSFDFGTKSGYSGNVGLNMQKEGVIADYFLGDSVRVYAGDYSFLTSEFRFSTPGTRKLSIMSNGSFGQFYDGKMTEISLRPNLNLSASLNISFEYGFNAIRFNKRETQNSLNIHLLNFKATYMLNTSLTATLITQYVNTEDELITNFRLRYNPREGTDFYLVLNDFRGLDNRNMLPPAPSFMGQNIMVKYVHTFIL